MFAITMNETWRSVSEFCDEPPKRTIKPKPGRGILAGPRSHEVECFGRFHEAHLTVAPGDPTAMAEMSKSCCTEKIRKRKSDPSILIFPRSHIEAALFYANASRRDIDINFMGRLNTKKETANRARQWIFDFVKTHMTPASLFIDTTVPDPAKYKPLGPFDASVDARGRPAGFRPLGVMGEQTTNPCVMAKCSVEYFHRLARSKFTLSPAGDQAWSQRFFEAIMAGSIPILQSQEHTGRNIKEKKLGYKYLLASEYAARRRKFPGPPPYCTRWAEHNLDIFLRHQSYIARRQTIFPSIDRCVAEAFEK